MLLRGADPPRKAPLAALVLAGSGGLVLGAALATVISSGSAPRVPAGPALAPAAPPAPPDLAPALAAPPVPDELARLAAELEAERTGRRQDREAIAALTEQLLEAERRLREALALRALVPEPGPPPAAATAALAAPPEPAPAGPDPWLAVLNDLLALDGYTHLRFEGAERVPGRAELHDATVLGWSSSGLLDTVLKARRVEFELHRMTHTLVARFFDGHRTQGGARVALPPEGVRMDFPGVRVEAWLEHFPELADSCGPAAAAPAAEVEPVRAAVDALLSMKGSHGYYRLAAVGAVEGDRLRFVQVNWFHNSGRLLKTFDADALQVLLHGDGTVELELRNGAIFEGGFRRPFAGDRFRIFLPRQPLDDWRRSGVPCVEAAD